MPNDVRIVFETQPKAIRVCSPAFVSRLAPVCFEEKNVDVSEEEITAKGLIMNEWGGYRLPVSKN